MRSTLAALGDHPVMIEGPVHHLTAGMIFGGIVLLIIVWCCIAAIIANTKALNEEKRLRAELANIQRAFNVLPDDISADDPRLTALNRRIANYKARFEVWQRSPFVISR